MKGNSLTARTNRIERQINRGQRTWFNQTKAERGETPRPLTRSQINATLQQFKSR